MIGYLIIRGNEVCRLLPKRVKFWPKQQMSCHTVSESAYLRALDLCHLLESLESKAGMCHSYTSFRMKGTTMVVVFRTPGTLPNTSATNWYSSALSRATTWMLMSRSPVEQAT